MLQPIKVIISRNVEYNSLKYDAATVIGSTNQVVGYNERYLIHRPARGVVVMLRFD